MTSVFRRFRLLAMTGVIALSLSAFAGTAAAASGPACNHPLVGALNMVHSWGVGAGFGVDGGMARAMTVDNVNGNGGMSGAVLESSAGCS
jgi:hypothetical protein